MTGYLRVEPRSNVEGYLAKAEGDKAKRPNLLGSTLRALLDEDQSGFEEKLLASLDGTTLYHVGCQRGFRVDLPPNVADHVIRLK